MSTFRSKPNVIEAVQWNGPESNLPMVKEHCVPDWQTVGGCAHLYSVRTAHGQDAYLEKGDWIITEPNGNGYYPCKPDIFLMKYELVT